MMSSSRDYDVIVLGGGRPASTALPRWLLAGCASRSSSGNWSAASAPMGVYSLEVAVASGEAVQGAREAGGSAQVDVSAALAWRDFMVSGYSDAGQQRWLAERGIELLRGTGRLAGIGVRRRGRPAHRGAHRRGDWLGSDRAANPGPA
jgi:pyruvate/2-oxoglutarate dehydrogenase complex dihydrolipoamide dehydrogenase (E3) component